MMIAKIKYFKQGIYYLLKPKFSPMGGDGPRSGVGGGVKFFSKIAFFDVENVIEYTGK